MYYVGSTRDVPSPTAAQYVRQAQQALVEAQAETESFLSKQLAGFSKSVAAAGIGLFSGNGQQ